MEKSIAHGELLTTTQAAELLGLQPNTLAIWRCRSRQHGRLVGPPFLRVGKRSIRYSRAALDAYLTAEGREAVGDLILAERTA